MANVNMSPVETRLKLHLQYPGYILGDPALNCFLFAFVVLFKLSKNYQILQMFCVK